MIATICMPLVAGCAARPNPSPVAGASCSVADLGQLGASSLPVTITSHDSMLSAAQALDAASSRLDPEAQPFAYKVRFEHPLTARIASPPRFVMTGLFARPCDLDESLALGWGYAHGEDNRTYAAIVPFEMPRDCPGKTVAVTSLDVAYAPPIEESPADHPALHGWDADFPQVIAALKKNRALFGNGVEALEVTTVQRLGLDESRPTGCMRTIYSRTSNAHRRLSALDPSRAVIEMIEAGRPSKRASLAGYCTAGHYLIFDAATAEAIEHGTYRRREYFASTGI
jgi:hypothetical protein